MKSQFGHLTSNLSITRLCNRWAEIWVKLVKPINSELPLYNFQKRKMANILHVCPQASRYVLCGTRWMWTLSFSDPVLPRVHHLAPPAESGSVGVDHNIPRRERRRWDAPEEHQTTRTHVCRATASISLSFNKTHNTWTLTHLHCLIWIQEDGDTQLLPVDTGSEQTC